jgi:hypothetical protein
MSGRYVTLKLVRLYFVISESTRHGDLAMEVIRLREGGAQGSFAVKA